MSEKIRFPEESILADGYGITPFRVMKDRRLSVTAKAIYSYLSSLAGGANLDDDRKAWPSRDRICKDLGVSKNTYTRHLAQLKEYGYITTPAQKKDNGRWSRNVFILETVIACPKICDTVPPGETEKSPASTVSQNTVHQNLGHITNTIDLPIPEDLNNNIDQSRPEAFDSANETSNGRSTKATKNLKKNLRNSYPNDFETFWTEYPRKADKAEAHSIWEAIVTDKSLEITPEQLTQAAARYREAMQQENRQTKHIKLAKTWMNQSLAEYLQDPSDPNEDLLAQYKKALEHIDD